jgi:hypothetical protein
MIKAIIKSLRVGANFCANMCIPNGRVHPVNIDADGNIIMPAAQAAGPFRIHPADLATVEISERNTETGAAAEDRHEKLLEDDVKEWLSSPEATNRASTDNSFTNDVSGSSLEPVVSSPDGDIVRDFTSLQMISDEGSAELSMPVVGARRNVRVITDYRGDSVASDDSSESSSEDSYDRIPQLAPMDGVSRILFGRVHADRDDSSESSSEDSYDRIPQLAPMDGVSNTTLAPRIQRVHADRDDSSENSSVGVLLALNTTPAPRIHRIDAQDDAFQSASYSGDNEDQQPAQRVGVPRTAYRVLTQSGLSSSYIVYVSDDGYDLPHDDGNRTTSPTISDISEDSEDSGMMESEVSSFDAGQQEESDTIQVSGLHTVHTGDSLELLGDNAALESDVV